MKTNDLVIEIESTFNELVDRISSLNENEINTVPFEGSWTAGQLARHLIISGSKFVELLNGPVKETEREPDALVENFRAFLLDFSTKMTAQDIVTPEKKDYKKDYLLTSLENIKEGMKQVIVKYDLTKTMALELPVLGALTRLEAVHFVSLHTQRHVHQLKDICLVLDKKSPE
ncbi:MAG: DinB family protein [Ignavibacteriales bacterium]|nr:DinB family protein [Ignavibacteriales bacterium]